MIPSAVAQRVPGWCPPYPAAGHGVIWNFKDHKSRPCRERTSTLQHNCRAFSGRPPAGVVSSPLDVCFVNAPPVLHAFPWERRRLACFRSGRDARAPRHHRLAQDLRNGHLVLRTAHVAPARCSSAHVPSPSGHRRQVKRAGLVAAGPGSDPSPACSE